MPADGDENVCGSLGDPVEAGNLAGDNLPVASKLKVVVPEIEANSAAGLRDLQRRAVVDAGTTLPLCNGIEVKVLNPARRH